VKFLIMNWPKIKPPRRHLSGEDQYRLHQSRHLGDLATDEHFGRLERTRTQRLLDKAKGLGEIHT
jgi:hypothetical protein